jgi:hypothetical protein
VGEMTGIQYLGIIDLDERMILKYVYLKEIK